MGIAHIAIIIYFLWPSLSPRNGSRPIKLQSALFISVAYIKALLSMCRITVKLCSDIFALGRTVSCFPAFSENARRSDRTLTLIPYPAGTFNPTEQRDNGNTWNNSIRGYLLYYILCISIGYKLVNVVYAFVCNTYSCAHNNKSEHIQNARIIFLLLWNWKMYL